MTEEKPPTQEFKLDSDCELRFEVEKNEKVTLEVSQNFQSIRKLQLFFKRTNLHEKAAKILQSVT